MAHDREVVRILDVWEECRDIFSFKVRSTSERWRGFVPGQFALVWIPKVDEIPLSPADVRETEEGWEVLFTVKVVGEATATLRGLGEGAPLGLKGPLGRGYSLKEGGRVVGIAGGSGAPSVLSALLKSVREGGEGVLLLGAVTEEELPYLSWVEKEGIELLLSTDDGSRGRKGFVTELFEEYLSSREGSDPEGVSFVACGPERMLAALATLAFERGLDIQFSLERYIKCGVGLCDSCSISGLRVCTDGPVFSLEEVLQMDEFGRYRRGPSGRRIPL